MSLKEYDLAIAAPAPEPGVDFTMDVIDLAMRECLEGGGIDISVLTKEEQDQIFLAVIDAWTDWPAFNNEACNAATRTLKSLAVAGGWEEYLSWTP